MKNRYSGLISNVSIQCDKSLPSLAAGLLHHDDEHFSVFQLKVARSQVNVANVFPFP
jgi:hypothetical protein